MGSALNPLTDLLDCQKAPWWMCFIIIIIIIILFLILHMNPVVVSAFCGLHKSLYFTFILVWHIFPIYFLHFFCILFSLTL